MHKFTNKLEVFPPFIDIFEFLLNTLMIFNVFRKDAENVLRLQATDDIKVNVEDENATVITLTPNLRLSPALISTLSASSQSPFAIQQLIDCGFLTLMATHILGKSP